MCERENPPGTAWCVVCGVFMTPPADSPEALAGGTDLHDGSYTVVGALARGGFGITYQCFDRRLKCAVAVKEFFPAGCVRLGTAVIPTAGWSRQAYGKGRRAFLQEGERLARFDHSGIVRVRAAFEENETAYIVMEYLRGRSLAEILLARGQPLDEPAALEYLVRLGAALGVVHEAGMLHRDLKPSNVMVTDDGRLVLIDFGNAREYARDLSQSHSATVTAGYAPLEQYSRHGVRGPFSDIYGLAATGWHLLTGLQPPAASDRAVGVPLPSLQQLNPQVSSTAAGAMERGLAMEPALRPQSVEEFLDLLRGKAPPSGSGSSSPGVAALPVHPLPSPSGINQPPPVVVSGMSPLPTPIPSLQRVLGPDATTEDLPRRAVLPGGSGRRMNPRQGAWVLVLLVASMALGSGLLALMRWGGPSWRSESLTGTPSQPSPAHAGASPGQEIVNEVDGSVLLAVPGGTYVVGSTEAEISDAAAEATRAWSGFERKWLEAETPAHSVHLAPYHIGKHEVTNGQFRRFVAATGFKAAGDWQECARKWGEDAPVVRVSWNDAVAYCDWAGLRLPSEEEWEAAARGPQAGKYPWGNQWDPSLCRNSADRTGKRGPAAVGSHPGGASWCGALDMAGNAWEWTASSYEPYPGNVMANKAYGQDYRVFRGGSWDNANAVYFRSAIRIRYAPAHRFNDLGGFRCARTP